MNSIIIEKRKDEEGGGYIVYIPELDEQYYDKSKTPLSIYLLT